MEPPKSPLPDDVPGGDRIVEDRLSQHGCHHLHIQRHGDFPDPHAWREKRVPAEMWIHCHWWAWKDDDSEEYHLVMFWKDPEPEEPYWDK